MQPQRRPAYDGADLVGLIWQLVYERDFEPADFVIAGSARLWIDGYIREVSDLDVVARGATWERAWDMALRGEALFGEGSVDHAKVIRLFGDRVEVGDHWVLPTISADELIDEADVIGGLRYFRLETVQLYKKYLDRAKDRTDLEALRVKRPRLPDPIDRLRSVKVAPLDTAALLSPDA
ncbi:hypothetical protein [Glycomyces arizonensis]|uniref:hypothetical protein n=1 Tax=Glycomyces arizonensis TaxID=256035 RepID=UPI00047D42EC|nr:hypothetical protein [Glycomyces arizonensis]